MEVDQKEIIDALKTVLNSKSNFEEPSFDSILSHISSFVEAGLSGELTGKEWTERYGNMSTQYLSKYLNEAKALGFESTPLTPTTIRKTLNTNKRSVTEKRNRHAAIVAFSKYLVLQGKLPESRLEEIKALRPKRNVPVKKRLISREEIDLIIAHIKDSKHTRNYDKELLITAIEIAEETGLRIGEICSIKLCDLDLKKQELYIPRAKGGYDFTKGLTKRICQLLQGYLSNRARTESLYLLVLDNGKPLSRETLIQRFRRITKKIGLDTSFHAFRRRYITRHLQGWKKPSGCKPCCQPQKSTNDRTVFNPRYSKIDSRTKAMVRIQKERHET